jgi:cobalt-zinc-cadmium resistance protein CzcA
MGLNQTDTYLLLKPMSEWRMDTKEELMEEIRKVLDPMPGIDYSFTQPIEMRVSEMIIGVRGDLAVKVYGPDLATLNQLGGKIESLLKTIQGNQDVYTVQNDGVQYLRVEIDRLQGPFRADVETIQDALRVQIEGRQAGLVIEGNQRTPILIRSAESVRNSPAEFDAVRITTPDGKTIPLSAVAKLERADGPVKIDREMGSRYSVVIANVSGRDLVGFVEEAKALVAQQVELPNGYRISWGAIREPATRAARLSVVVPVALGLIFVLLFSTFGSVRQALLILSNIPFALVGGIVALWVTGEYLSVPASVGFIALLGIAVLNGIVLVSYFNQLHGEGLPMREVVLRAHADDFARY